LKFAIFFSFLIAVKPFRKYSGQENKLVKAIDGQNFFLLVIVCLLEKGFTKKKNVDH